jgi:hypothetical protein
MAREVKWTLSAWSDLQEAADYIAEDSPGYAAAFVAEVRDAARSLDAISVCGAAIPKVMHKKPLTLEGQERGGGAWGARPGHGPCLREHRSTLTSTAVTGNMDMRTGVVP